MTGDGKQGTYHLTRGLRTTQGNACPGSGTVGSLPAASTQGGAAGPHRRLRPASGGGGTLRAAAAPTDGLHAPWASARRLCSLTAAERCGVGVAILYPVLDVIASGRGRGPAQRARGGGERQARNRASRTPTGSSNGWGRSTCTTTGTSRRSGCRTASNRSWRTDRHRRGRTWAGSVAPLDVKLGLAYAGEFQRARAAAALEHGGHARAQHRESESQRDCSRR